MRLPSDQVRVGRCQGVECGIVRGANCPPHIRLRGRWGDRLRHQFVASVDELIRVNHDTGDGGVGNLRFCHLVGSLMWV